MVTQQAKTDPGCGSQLPLLFHGPASFPGACSLLSIQKALNNLLISISFSRDSCSGLGPQIPGESGHGGRPASGTCGYSLARATFSLHWLPPPAVCPHLGTYDYPPTRPLIIHTSSIWGPAPSHVDTRLSAPNQTPGLPSSYLPSLGKTSE